MLRFYDIEQGSRDWKAWRLAGIGGSDAPEIMGCGYLEGGAAALLEEKCGGAEREENFEMRRGKKLEPDARRMFQTQHGLILPPACVARCDPPWMQASLDGIDLWGEVLLEIKAPDMIDHGIALAGVVPHQFKPQLQHLLMVTEARLLYYASYSIAKRYGGVNKPSLAVVQVHPDAVYQAFLAAAEEQFWKQVLAARQRITALADAV